MSNTPITKKNVMIVTGEASGDLHGAHLVRSLQKSAPELTFCGMGGAELEAAGVEMLFDAAKISVVGLTEVISHLGDILAARRTLIKRLQEKRPALLILIDYPDFNLLLAAKAKKLGIPVFYYISPQVWAWRKKRTGKIGRLSNRIGVILPFEKEFYARYGVSVDFVGHPLVDSVQRSMETKDFLTLHNISPDNTIIGLLPGSRSKEIRNLLPDFLRSAVQLANTLDGNCTFLLPRASTISLDLLRENGLDEFENQIDIRVISENRYDLMGACKAVIAASGTVTLELAILNVPAVTTYRVSPRTYRIGRLLVRDVEFFSLVNLIGGRRIIPELLQDEVTPGAIAGELKELLVNEQERTRVLQGLAEVRGRLGRPGASERAAQIALEIIQCTPGELRDRNDINS